jgi:hypothetical protein
LIGQDVEDAGGGIVDVGEVTPHIASINLLQRAMVSFYGENECLIAMTNYNNDEKNLLENANQSVT